MDSKKHEGGFVYLDSVEASLWKDEFHFYTNQFDLLQANPPYGYIQPGEYIIPGLTFCGGVECGSPANGSFNQSFFAE
jgi:hypothetical protein